MDRWPKVKLEWPIHHPQLGCDQDDCLLSLVCENGGVREFWREEEPPCFKHDLHAASARIVYEPDVW